MLGWEVCRRPRFQERSQEIGFGHIEVGIIVGYPSGDVNQAMEIPVQSSEERPGLECWVYSAVMTMKCYHQRSEYRYRRSLRSEP